MKARLIEDGGAAAVRRRAVLPLPALPRGGGGDPHAGDRGRARAAPAADRPADRRGPSDSTRSRPTAIRAPTAPRRTRQTRREIDWSETGLVSVFVRDRIGERPCFAGGTVRSPRPGGRGRGRRPQAPPRADPPQRAPRLGASGWSPAARWTMQRSAASSAPTPRRWPARGRRSATSIRPATSSALLLSERSWLVLAEREGEPAGRRDCGRERRLPALLPRRYGGRGPRGTRR